MNCDEISLLLSARMDGELTPEENKVLEEHLASCPECRALSAQLEEVRSAFAGLEDMAAPEGFSDRVMNELRRQEEQPRVVSLFRRPAVRAILGAAACLALCVGLLGGRLTGGQTDGAVPFAVMEDSAPAQAEARAVGEEELPALTLERLPEGEALSGLAWEEEDDRLVAHVDGETLETVMALAKDQGIAARLSGSPEAGEDALLVLPK